MKGFKLLILVFLFMSFTILNYANAKTILLDDIKVEVVTKVVNINRIPLLIQGLTKYFENNDLLKNYYTKTKSTATVKENTLRVTILRYEKNKYILFNIKYGKNDSEGTIIKVKLGKFAEYRKITPEEKKARESIKKYYMREELNETDADAYTFYTVLIGLGVDKALKYK